MAVVEVPKSASVSIKLTGPNSGGTAKTLSVSMGSIVRGADNDRIMNVANLAANIFAYPVARIQKSVVTTLENDA